MDAAVLIADALSIDVKHVPGDASIEKFTPWDSLGHMKIVMSLEEVIGRSLETEEILSITDLASLQTLLDRQ